jgi:hypothetical protein
MTLAFDFWIKMGAECGLVRSGEKVLCLASSSWCVCVAEHLDKVAVQVDERAVINGAILLFLLLGTISDVGHCLFDHNGTESGKDSGKSSAPR